MVLNKKTIMDLLNLEDFNPIYKKADQVRKKIVGDIVHIRGIIEFSNYCCRECHYCGLNINNSIERYRMPMEEVLKTGLMAKEAGYKTLVLQSGEDPGLNIGALGKIVKELNQAGLIITISCGELSKEELSYLKKMGAERYLLKHETSNKDLYKKLHPCGSLSNRIKCLKDIKDLGFETGGGFMVGLPGQTIEVLAEDILLLKEIGCDMAGIGPFIQHPLTPLLNEQPGSAELTKRAVAITRLLLPNSNLPVTTSLGVISINDRNKAFECGANVVMKKVTPDKYKRLYEIYPSDFTITDIKKDREALEKLIVSLGRIPL